MKKLIFLMLLIPALCWGQATIGKFIAKKGGVKRYPDRTIIYQPWGAITTHYIGQPLYDATTPNPAIYSEKLSPDSLVIQYWTSIFFAKLDFMPPLKAKNLEVWLNDGAVTGIMSGGSSAVCQEQAQAIIDILVRNPYGEVIDSDGEIVYKLERSQ